MSDYNFWEAEEWEAWITNKFMECLWHPERGMCPMCKANIVNADGYPDWNKTCADCGFYQMYGCLCHYSTDSERLNGAWKKLKRLNVI